MAKPSSKKTSHPDSDRRVDAVYERIRTDQLRLPNRRMRKHPPEQISQLMSSIRTFGFIAPIIVDPSGTIVAGEARFEAARQLGLTEVPALRVEHLSPEEIRAYRIADNRQAEKGDWDEAALRDEVTALLDTGFNLEALGFSLPDIDALLTLDPPEGVFDSPLERPSRPVIAQGDLFEIGRHRLLCGDARNPEHCAQLMNGEQAAAAFNDPPYNLPAADVAVRKHQQRAFLMASGEMSPGDFEVFLQQCLQNTGAWVRPGGIMFTCMDWRQLGRVLSAGETLKLDLLNIAVWAKPAAGMGSFYRSQHEMVVVFRKPGAGHVNNVQLGKNGRYRTNVWSYPGGAGFFKGRSEDLDRHPTPKPVQMVADALLDCTHRGDIVLDLFGGGGTTMIAAERTGRQARLMELDPGYAEASLLRFAKQFGISPLHVASGLSFDEFAEHRRANSAFAASDNGGSDDL